VMTSPTVSQIGSEHRAHSNKRCMVFSTSPHSPEVLYDYNVSYFLKGGAYFVLR
jgi:hypothetical protein